MYIQAALQFPFLHKVGRVANISTWGKSSVTLKLFYSWRSKNSGLNKYFNISKKVSFAWFVFHYTARNKHIIKIYLSLYFYLKSAKNPLKNP